MSSQLEFIMQLYMMNLLQQQQQHHQQQQQQLQQQQAQPSNFLCSPVKNKDLLNQTQNTNLSNQTRLNSQNIMCSSSRSSSPNSNLSPLPNTINSNNATNFPPTPQTLHPLAQLTAAQTQPMTQMLLSNLSPLTQFMLLQQQQQQHQQQMQQQQQQITSSNLLLTPTTPNSSPTVATADSCDNTTQTVLNGAGYLANNNCITTPSIGAASALLSATASSASSPSSSLFFPSIFTAQYPFVAGSSQSHFLQSSTVTSTPCSDSSLAIRSDKSIATRQLMSNVSAAVVADNSLEVVSGTAADASNTSDENDVAGVSQKSDEDAQVFSSLHSSSGNSSSTTGNSKLMCSGIMTLETTPDSMEDSAQMPYTPEKSNNQLLPYKDSLAGEDDKTNVTPVSLKNAILTPPSSEQLSSNQGQTFESSICGQTGSSATTAAIMSGVDSFLTEENLKHLRKNSSYLECENPLCRQENLREHFHCYEEPCEGKILSKKDDIIRHLKWHKKRKESLLLGFARFSSSDDCAPEYGPGCNYNWKQTHYHCVYEDCPKVYVSTSDVQMHANFHRKNSEIVQEGFRRFRAHENCKIEDCPFYGKKTSHYHCCREGCNHTFKNKADMDKHKTYHMKDHQLIQDGFKKILKTEQCPFEDCKFSTVSNHIHCVREGCNFILHSSTQMISHKRKHDRSEGEQNYQQFKTEKDASHESPKPQVRTRIETRASSSSSSSTSTPLSSLSAEHFLARKRGRPPKKIQLPAETSDSKRLKLEANSAEITNGSNATNNPVTLSMLNPFLASNAAAMDANAPNLQLTHLMALFQLQNPLFYQNLYPGGMTAANMANLLGGTIPNIGNNNSNVKHELNEKNDFKE